MSEHKRRRPILDWSTWWEILKEYGPILGLFIAFIIWQSKKIDQLLDRHEKAYSGEITRMDAHLTRLLNHILGPQPSSTEMPTIPELIADAEGKKEIEGMSEGDQP